MVEVIVERMKTEIENNFQLFVHERNDENVNYQIENHLTVRFTELRADYKIESILDELANEMQMIVTFNDNSFIGRMLAQINHN